MALKSIKYKNHNFDISYIAINNNASKNIAFLHGWGSNKELMRLAFKDSFKDFNHIYIDLVGFGGSSNPAILLDTFMYAKIIKLFLEQVSINEIKDSKVVVGHSFGGKIALLLQKEIILLSSAGILLKKPLSIKLKIAFSKALRFLKIKSSVFRASDAKGLTKQMYEIFKVVVNEDFKPCYKSFDKKASIFWGKNDEATPLECFNQIKEVMKDSRFFALEGDHYFFLKQAKLIESLYYKGEI